MRRTPVRLALPAWALAALLATTPARVRADEPPPAKPDPAPAPAEPAPKDPGRMFDPRFREGAPADVLARGEVPLLRGTLDAFVDLIEGVYDVAFLAAEEQAVRDAIESSWPRMTPEEQRWFDDMARRRADLRTMLGNGTSQEVVRQKQLEVSGALDVRLLHSPKGPWQALVLAAKARAAEVFSPGAPPLSRADVEAFEELVAFLVSLARNDATAPTPGQQAQEREALRKAMGESGALVRGRYDRMGRFWLLVKSRWDSADVLARLRLRGEVLEVFRPMAGLPPLSGTVALDLSAYAGLAKEVADALPVFEAYHGALGIPGPLLDAVLEGLGIPAKDVEAAFDTPSLGLR